ncbi:MAG: hypothetical protein JWO94_159 [Verrucomicrobiaceae bacterium]|nr:hypothetical protein [Verrucomicrobiaceae bacterium]
MPAALPEPIATYFEAANAGHIEQACACFAANAQVHDEAQDHVGLSAIHDWLEESTRKYAPQIEVTGTRQLETALIVDVKVSGTFPGSPVKLAFQFSLNDDKITQLNIQ